MTNRTTLLLIGVGLSLTLRWLTSTLQAQEPGPPFSPPQMPSFPDIQPPPYCPPPPPFHSEPAPPFWLELLKDDPHLAACVVGAVVAVPVCIVVHLVRGILGLMRGSASGRDGPGKEP
jgi:hypothetical protein